MKEETKLFCYTVVTFILSILLLSIGVLLYFYFSIFTINGKFISDIFYDFAMNLILWELIVVICGVFLFYRLFKIHLKHKLEVQSIFKGLFEAVSHRFGNYIAAQKVNVELLKYSKNNKIIDRLEMSLSNMENDFNELVLILKNLELETLSLEDVYLSSMIRQLTEDMSIQQTKNIDLKIVGRDDVKLTAEYLFAKIVFVLLLDNAFRYSKSKIYICYKKNKNNYCLILNDINKQSREGTGLGLKLVKYFTDKIGVRVRTKRSNSWFCCLLVWK